MDIPSLEELSYLHNHICQVVSDPKRIQILYALHRQPQHVSALAEALGFPQPTVSRHLKILRERHLVQTRREGPTVVYSLAEERIITVLEIMRGVLHEHLTTQGQLIQNNFLTPS